MPASEKDSVVVVGVDRPTLDKDIKTLSNNGKRWVVVDGAPRSEQMTVSTIKAADIVLIPVQPSPYDVWAAEDPGLNYSCTSKVTDGKPKAAF